MIPDSPQASDNVHVRVFDAAEAPTAEAARRPETEPQAEFRTHNATRDVYHETVVSALNGVTPDLTVDALALGDSTKPTRDVADGRPLANETFRTGVLDTFVDGQDFVVSAFLDSTEANGQVFEEISLIAEQPTTDLPINRALLDDPGGLLDPKTQGSTVTIDVTIRQEDSS
jgi:hypothetical protein